MILEERKIVIEQCWQEYFKYVRTWFIYDCIVSSVGRRQERQIVYKFAQSVDIVCQQARWKHTLDKYEREL